MSTQPAPEELTPHAWVAQHKARDASGRFRQLRNEDGQSVSEDGRPLFSPQADAVRQAYLDLVAGGASVREACVELGIELWRPWQWEARDREFGAALAMVDHGVLGVLGSNLRRLGRGDGMAAVRRCGSRSRPCPSSLGRFSARTA